MRSLAMLFSMTFALATFALADPGPPAQDEPKADEKAKAKEKEKEKPSPEEEKPVVTHHEVTIDGKRLKYTATAGLMPIKDDKGEVEGRIFFMAYTADDAGDRAARPLMFSFNGGPGSASVWLHLGAVGPKRVKVPSDAGFAKPPYQLIDNEWSWLDQTDLVFIDPVGTGYSRPAKPEQGKNFYSVEGDLRSVGEFIRMYLTRNERWASPLFLVGESYGTTRAAGLSGQLIDRGIAFNGIVLVSSVLNFQTISFGRGNDLPYILYLPTYAATAWYHKKLPADLQGDLAKTLDEVERWAVGDYAEALERGDRLSADERRGVVAKLARYTGLSEEFVDESNLRVSGPRFSQELLRKDRKVVGRFDSRYTGLLGQSLPDAPRFDPSLAAVMPAYTAMLNQYVRAELGYKTDAVYHVLGTGIGPWDWGQSGGFSGYTDVSAALKEALSQNPQMRLFVASGHYDLATPYAGTEYTIAHLGLDPKLRANIRMEEYEAGHMMYVHDESLKKLKADVGSFIRDAAGR